MKTVAPPASMIERVDRLELHAELERLDREWAQERERHLLRGEGGSYEPTRAIAQRTRIGAVILPIALVAIGVFSASRTSLDAGATMAWFMGGLGLVGGVAIWLVAASHERKAVALEAARAAYDRQREALLSKLAKRERKAKKARKRPPADA